MPSSPNGERIVARGRVSHSTLAQSEVFAVAAGEEKLIAFLTATIMSIKGRNGIAD